MECASFSSSRFSVRFSIRQVSFFSLRSNRLRFIVLERDAAEVIAFYSTSSSAGSLEPDLDFFSAYYLDSASMIPDGAKSEADVTVADVHQAARMLFCARLDRMTEVEIEEVVTARRKDRKSPYNCIFHLTACSPSLTSYTRPIQ